MLNPGAVPLNKFGRSIAYVGGGIGDVVMHIGHFQTIARASSNGKVSIACRPQAAISELFEGSDFVEDVVGLRGGLTGHSPTPFWTVVRELRAGAFDTMIFLRSSIRVMAAARAAGIRQRIGYVRAYDPRSWLLTYRTIVPAKTENPHHLTKSDRLLNALGLPFDTATARLAPTARWLEEARPLMANRNAIAIGLNCGEEDRQWGERYAELVRRIGQNFKIDFVLYGGRDVLELARHVRTHSNLQATRFIDIPEMGYSLGMSHALLNGCLAYVGNDSSGVNLAVFCGLPAIGLFAVTPPFTYSPLFVGIEPEHRERGIDGISVDQVYDRVHEFLVRSYPQLKSSAPESN